MQRDCPFVRGNNHRFASSNAFLLDHDETIIKENLNFERNKLVPQQTTDHFFFARIFFLSTLPDHDLDVGVPGFPDGFPVVHGL